MRGFDRRLAVAIEKAERHALHLPNALREVMVDPKVVHFDRGKAGKLLSIAGDDQAVKTLLEIFFAQSEKDDLYATALSLEALNDRRAVPPLIDALMTDPNPHRRHAAARALGWIRKPGRAAALALARCLTDPTQPQPAREEAAESLSYAGTRETIDSLISVFGNPDVRIRFWAVFGLGGSFRGEPRAVRALESMLDDQEVTPGNWWSVGKEALSMLCHHYPSIADYGARLKGEAQRILADPNASAEDRRWAKQHR